MCQLLLWLLLGYLLSLAILGKRLERTNTVPLFRHSCLRQLNLLLQVGSHGGQAKDLSAVQARMQPVRLQKRVGVARCSQLCSSLLNCWGHQPECAHRHLSRMRAPAGAASTGVAAPASATGKRVQEYPSGPGHGHLPVGPISKRKSCLLDHPHQCSSYKQQPAGCTAVCAWPNTA